MKPFISRQFFYDLDEFNELKTQKKKQKRKKQMYIINDLLAIDFDEYHEL